MLAVVPINISDANVLVKRWHRHHKPVTGALFAIAVARTALATFDGGNAGEGWREESELCGAVIVGRPVARMLQDGFTAEVNRCVTDGTKNCCSMLYGAAWRAAKAMGYRRLVTYTLPEEGGSSLRAAGWKLIGEAGGGSWSVPSRPRVDRHPLQTKLRWEAS
jgi:hypothetical protein